MENGINVLSYFDGMSCGQIALKQLGIKVNNYFACEIDKFAIAQTKLNFPNTIHLGRVEDIDINKLPKIDLYLGGSPCQGFSFAGKRLNFDDPRSKLFFNFANDWQKIKAINPNAKFLLENVDMRRNELRVISEYMELLPVNLNSSLVSAQNRNRWYWSNIKTATDWTGYTHTYAIPPKDRGLFIKDILQPESEIEEKYFLSDKLLKYMHRASDKHKSKKNGFAFKPFNLNDKKKAFALTASYHKRSVSDNYIKCSNGRYRALTIKECANLQTVPDWYKWECSNTQAYRMLGNGWTIEMIMHILQYLKN